MCSLAAKVDVTLAAGMYLSMYIRMRPPSPTLSPTDPVPRAYWPAARHHLGCVCIYAHPPTPTPMYTMMHMHTHTHSHTHTLSLSLSHTHTHTYTHIHTHTHTHSGTGRANSAKTSRGALPAAGRAAGKARLGAQVLASCVANFARCPSWSWSRPGHPRLHYRLLTLCPAAYWPCAPRPTDPVPGGTGRKYVLIRICMYMHVGICMHMHALICRSKLKYVYTWSMYIRVHICVYAYACTHMLE